MEARGRIGVLINRAVAPAEDFPQTNALALDASPYMTAERFNVTGGFDKD
jgi:hypothetical protein